MSVSTVENLPTALVETGPSGDKEIVRVPPPPEVQWFDGRPDRASLERVIAWMWRYRADAVPAECLECEPLDRSWVIISVLLAENHKAQTLFDDVSMIIAQTGQGKASNQ